ncbi:MAG TPA: magnesium-translocating P-type ATPase [Candidatus Eisenbacteria bacterium]|nr:magnesium-translocating P-type ATPase [Candidatus Eisenbacteria bacterium]
MTATAPSEPKPDASSAPAQARHARPPAGPPFWQQSPRDVLAALDTDGRGLTTAEAARRLAVSGRNVFAPPRQRALVLQFLARFANPLLLLLLVAAGISGATGDVASALIITGMIVLSVTLDFVQEARAGRAAERLQKSVALTARVVRDGRGAELPAAEIVPGDVIELAAGDLVPADGLVLEANDCTAQQALLTGEPFPAEKRAGEAAAPGAAAGEAVNAVFMGTSIVSGSARMVACRTGAATAFGEIRDTLARRPPATAFESALRSFGLLILRIAVVMVAGVLVVNAAFHRPWLESFLFAVALAVGLTPELLPMVMSVTLARGAMRMAKQRVIVKRLSAVHDLGSMDVLCTDKTGTLTEARIRLERHVDAAGRDSARVLELAFVNSALQAGLRSPLDDAILRHAEVSAQGWRKRDELPFDFMRRCVSVLAEHDGEVALVTKGACEDVIARATRYEADGPASLAPLDDAARAQLARQFQALSADGYRVLGVAWKAMPAATPHVTVADERELTFAGFAAFEDPPKAEAAAALAALAAGGVTVKIVTGDHELVAEHVCRELNMPVAGVVTGAELDGLDDAALAARVEQVTLFCRVTPPQKSRVIRALRARRHVVGYLGDGINDAPPLHEADVGISVDGAVDVARAAADLILLDHDLAVLQRGVREGRRTFANIVKYVMMGTSSNFGNMFSMAGGTLLLPFLPLLPVQILANNFLYDLSEVPIPLDRVDESMLARPPHWDVGEIRRFMLVVGPVSSVFDFLTFWVLRSRLHAGPALFHTGWFVESMATQVLVIFVIRTRGNPLRSRPSPVLVATSLAVVAVALALPWTPPGRWLGFVPLPAAFLALLAPIAVVYLLAVDVVKRLFYRSFTGTQRSRAVTR